MLSNVHVRSRSQSHPNCTNWVANFVGSAEMQIMDALKEAAEHLAEFEAELNGLGSGPFVVEGVTGNYVAKLLARIRATYTAMSDLVQAGHHDQMVVLFRRQLEDSMRLHYLAAHTEQSDALILGHQRMRDLKVRRRLDRVINNSETPSSMLPDLKMMVAKRRSRSKRLIPWHATSEYRLRSFPNSSTWLPSWGGQGISFHTLRHRRSLTQPFQLRRLATKAQVAKAAKLPA